MGSSLSQAQLREYQEVVRDCIPPEAIQFLHSKFVRAAPNGLMNPAAFARYMESTGVFKHRQLPGAAGTGNNNNSNMMMEGGEAPNAEQLSASVPPGLQDEGSDEAPTPSSSSRTGMPSGRPLKLPAHDDGAACAADGDLYLHLFRGYDLDGDGLITFKEFLLYHVAIVYSTEDLFLVVFNTYDADGDQRISLDDLITVVTASTRYVGDYDVRQEEVRRVIDEEARRIFSFLDIRKEGKVRMDDMRRICQKYPQVLEKLKYLM